MYISPIQKIRDQRDYKWDQELVAFDVELNCLLIGVTVAETKIKILKNIYKQYLFRNVIPEVPKSENQQPTGLNKLQIRLMTTFYFHSVL